jgi:hypothetical protein
MAYVPNRDDPFLLSPSPSMEEIRRRQDIEGDFQPDLKLPPDPTFEEGPASRMRVGLYAVAVLAVLGALFFGLNAANNSSQTASDTPTSAAPSSMAQSTTPPQPPVRNVTPGPNASPGVTTGQAPNAPAEPTK